MEKDYYLELLKLQVEVKYYFESLCPDIVTLNSFESRAKKLKSKIEDWEIRASQITLMAENR